MPEFDWKQLQKIIPEARDRYLKEKNELMARMLSSTGETETDKFWKAFDVMKKEAKNVNECLGDIRRSRFFAIVSLMHRHGMLRNDDLKLFSDSVQRYVSRPNEPDEA